MKKIVLLSNITADIITAKLSRKFQVYSPDGFDTWISDVMDQSSQLYKGNPDAVFILLDGMELRGRSQKETEQKIELWKNAIGKLKDQTETLLFVSTIDFREGRIRTYGERQNCFQWMDDWYQFIWNLSQEKSNIYVFDIFEIITDMGRNNFYSSKMWYMGSMPFSKAGVEAIVNEISLAMDAAFESRKKAAVLDLDNTLWGGVIGEDGIDGIVLSQHHEGGRFRDFQKCLAEMKKRGVVFAVNSKNNQEDAQAAFSHPSMVLKQDDFVCLKINWNDKVSNMKEIQEELNLTESSFIFIDDNPLERNMVSGQCPEVFVPEFPKDTAELPKFAEDLYKRYFRILHLTDEDAQKTKMYQEEAKRTAVKGKALDLDEYIRMLEIKADIHIMRDEEIGRVCQLCSKTNQFNLTTKRYDLKELKELASDNAVDIFTVSAADKFGDNGLISVVITRKSGSNVVIDTFLMSCRVMGRKLEQIILSVLIENYKDSKQLIGVYRQSCKNAPVADLYDRMGFSCMQNSDGEKRYSYDLSNPYPLWGSYAEIWFQGEKKQAQKVLEKRKKNED